MTDNIVDYIQENYKKETYVEIAEKFEVEPQEVKKMIVKLQRENRLFFKDKHLTKRDIEKAIKMNNEGMAIDKVSRKLGYSPQTILKAFQRMGIEYKKVLKRWTEEEEKEAIRLFEEGYTRVAISRKLNRSLSATSKRINQYIKNKGE